MGQAMSRKVKAIAAYGLGSAVASDIVLASFDGTPDTTRTWKQMNDPVMGGKSTGTFSVKDGAGIFDGFVADVPSLRAPGFIKTDTVDSKPFPDISSCKALDIIAEAQGQYTGYRLSFSMAQPAGARRHAYGYKSNYAPKEGGYSRVSIPLSNFTDLWDDATGDPIKTCEEDEQYCPDAKTLRNIETLGVWAEGVKGKVHLQIHSILASGCADADVAAEHVAADTVPLARFDGSASARRWKAYNDPVMGGKSAGTFTASNGLGVFDGEVVDVPKLQAPGFIQALTWDFWKSFPDISNCAAIDILAKATGDYGGYRLSFSMAHPEEGKQFAYGYKSHFVPTVGSFGRVSIPLANFTDFWDDATGEPIKTCQQDAKYCPDKKTLHNVRTLGVWAEGVAGKVHLEIKSIEATGCSARPVVPTQISSGKARMCPALPQSAKECPMKNISDPEFEPVCITRGELAEIQQRRCMKGEKAPYYNDSQGGFRCACCGALLWMPSVQFDEQPASSWPWPSFHSPAQNGTDGLPNVCHRGPGYGIGNNTQSVPDLGLGVEGEVGCARCGEHLGDYFNTKDEGMDHYCIDGVCMTPPGGKPGEVCAPTMADSSQPITI